MAHTRKRHAFSLYQELLGFSPLLGILGHRQVGKTTFIEAHAKQYFSFDDEDILNEAKASPKKFIQSIRGLGIAIDESQLVEGIFPALKECVRVSKKPGQFVLSGSVRFTSKASIHESLTGRIQYIEMLPMSIAELSEDPLDSKLKKIFESKNLNHLKEDLSLTEKTSRNRQKRIDTYLTNGGLPGICFIRNHKLRNDKILDQLKTILDRDLRQVYKTKLSFHELYTFFTEVAHQEGRPYDYQFIKRKTGLSPITQKHLLYAFEAIFLIRRIPIEGDSKSFSIFLEDQAESYLLTEDKLTRATQILSLLYRNLRTEYFYRAGTQVKALQYKNRSGSIMPLVFKTPNSTVGFIYSENEDPSRKIKGSVGTFLKHYADSKVIIVHEGKKAEVISPRILTCPITWLL